MRRVAAAAVALALVGVAAWSLWPAAPAHQGPNLLVIVWDTVRADRLSLYGHDVPTTPRLETWAEEAVVFDQAISPAMWTPPSHSSMFTGFAPTHHGVKATYKWLDDHHTTLAEWLGEHGYETYAFSANPYVAPVSNITQGFGVVDNTFEGRWRKEARKATRKKLIPTDASTDVSPMWKPQPGQRTPGLAHAYKDAGPVAHKALVQWLEQERTPDAPWFGFVNMMEAHIPRVPSMEARKAVATPEQIETALQTDVAQINLLAYTFGKVSYTPAELEAINLTYDAAIRDLDDATFDMLDDLAARGHLDNTIVVLTADHGENLGDHGMFGHKFGVFHTLIRVPLVVWYPPAVAPERVSTPVSNLNLFTTLLGLVGIEPPPTAIDGTVDLLAQRTQLPAFSELIEATPVSIKRIDELYGLDDKTRWLRTFRSVTDGTWKYVLASDGEEELFDLAADPHEAVNVTADHPAVATRLADTLRTWVADLPAYDPAQRSADDKRPKVDAKTRSMLEQLGYLDDDQ